MRTSEQFAQIYQRALKFINFHQKNVWIVPTKTDYILSVIKPRPNELPRGTVAIEVGLPLVNDTYTIHSEITSDK
ncbi:TPA: hypothetical protein ACMDOZ_002340 [Vibrio cholerae]